ncbi:hypothetical protein FB45DRAFT_10195 [Roridomyces roridus]|uniref:Uncharacterized protein n=1 Tax=Roridomyces roridus TaxID=1738132 RepID=A0AAD7G271_9AGAR|nr:hypothetical protein FB45DRAFT_10195 [Roridomyces roridus]
MFLRKAFLAAASALSILSSVQTPEVVHHSPLIVAELPPVPRLPFCTINEYIPPHLAFTPVNVSYGGDNASFTRAHFALIPLEVPTSDVRAQIPDLALVNSALAQVQITGLDLSSLDQAEGVLTAVVAVTRVVKRKTGVAWSTLLLSLLLLSGLLAMEVQLGQPGLLFAVSREPKYMLSFHIARAAEVQRRLFLSAKLTFLVTSNVVLVVATFNFASLEQVKVILAVAPTVARLIRVKTRQLAISLLVLSGILVFDGFQLGESGILVELLRGGVVALFALPWTQILNRLTLTVKAIVPHVAPVLFSTFDSCQGDILCCLAFDSTFPLTLERSLPIRFRDIVAPSPTPWVRRKRPRPKKMIRLRNKARLASIPIPPPPNWSDWLWALCDAFFAVLPTVLTLPFDIPFFDTGCALLRDGTFVHQLVHILYRYFCPLPFRRVRRSKERYRRGKKKQQRGRKP